MKDLIFEPFMDRLSRDIRNDLSESLVEAIRSCSMTPVSHVAGTYLDRCPAACYVHYIEDRLKRYREALAQISSGPGDPLFQGLVLWDNGLFFEVHEILEHAWLDAEGREKLLLQAMIRAAGVYIKMEYGYLDAARKIADKAIPVLEKEGKQFSMYANSAILVRALRNLAPAPHLLGTNTTGIG